MPRKGSKGHEEEIAEAYVKTMRNFTRAAIFDQLTRKPELTATEISKILGEDVDVVYYHMKSLKKRGLVTEPRVEVRGNYIEKYYSLTPEAKRIIESGEPETVTKKIDEMSPEEYRQLLMTAFALIQSATAGAANQVKRAGKDVITDLRNKRSIAIQLINCTREQYYELLKDLREISKTPGTAANRVELGYAIVFWAMPKLGEE